jgi:hypothetical protein
VEIEDEEYERVLARVAARDVKNAPGRPKTDKLDAVWLAKLTEHGMLRPSFVPRCRSGSCGTTPGCGST